MATMNSPDSASGPPVEVLAIYEDRGHKYHIVRARTGDMVRYYRVFAALSNRWPKGWQSPDSSFRLPIPRLDPSGPDAKCIDLYDPQPPWLAGGGRVAYGPGGEAMPLARAIPVALAGVPGVDHAVKLEYATFERVRVRAAFARLHAECRLFHGDCHLGNVLRRADGAIFLIDFELAMPLNSAGCVDDREDCTADAEDYEVDQWIGYIQAKAARSRVGASNIKPEGFESEKPAEEDCSSQH